MQIPKKHQHQQHLQLQVPDHAQDRSERNTTTASDAPTPKQIVLRGKGVEKSEERGMHDQDDSV